MPWMPGCNGLLRLGRGHERHQRDGFQHLESIKDTFRSGVNWVIDQVNGLIASINGLSIDIPSLTGGAPTHVDQY